MWWRKKKEPTMTTLVPPEMQDVFSQEIYDEFCHYIKKWHDTAIAAGTYPERELPYIDPELGIVLETEHGDAPWAIDKLVIAPDNNGYSVLRAGGRENPEDLYKDEFFSTFSWATRFVFFKYANYTSLHLKNVSANWYFLDLPLADTFRQEETERYKYITTLLADPTHYYVTGLQRGQTISHYITRSIPDLDELVETADPPRP